MVAYIMKQELLQNLYKMINPKNKFTMINFVKFYSQLLISKDEEIMTYIIKNKLMSELINYFYIYS